MKTRKELEQVIGMQDFIPSRVYTILQNAIEQHINGSLRADHVFIYDSSSGKMSHSLECYNSHGSVYSHVHHEIVKLKSGTLSLDLNMPPVMESGRLHDLHVYSLEGLVAYANKAKIRLPFDPLDSKSGIRFVTRDSFAVYSSDGKARFTDSSRVVSCINNFLKYTGFPPMPTVKTNPILAAIESVHKLAGYSCEWLHDDESISDVYNDEDSGTTGYSSCMSGKPTSFFELYDDLEIDGSLSLVHLIDGEGNRRGRALCWKGSNPNDLYLDRLYLPEYSSVQDPLAQAAFKEFCIANGITKTVFQKTADALDLEFKSISIKMPIHIHNYHYAPYADSMYRVCEDGKLRNHSGSGYAVLTELRNTDGSVDLEQEEPDGIYICRHGDTFPEDECVTVRDGTWELAEDCEQLESHYYGRNTYELKDECVRTYDNSFILLEDAILLYDKTYAHVDEATEIEDGTERYGLTSECGQLSDGRWVLEIDRERLEADLASETEA